MSKRKIILIFLVIAAVAGGVLGFNVFTNGTQNKGNDLFIYGNVDVREVNLAFYATGRIAKLLVDEGDKVKKGQLLAELEDSRYRHAVAKLKSDLAAQRDLLARLKNGSRPQEKADARARVEAAEARLELAKITARRIEELSKTDFVSKQKRDNAEAELRAAKAALKSAREHLSLVLEGPRTEDIQRAEAQLKSLVSALALAEEELADTKLYSPAEGIIQNRILEPGSMAFPNTPVFSLALTDPIWVRAYIPEPSLGRVKKGMKVEVTSDSFPEIKYQGWVGFISPVAEFTPKSVQTTELRTRLVYRARCFVKNSNGELRLGMPVTVRVLTEE